MGYIADGEQGKPYRAKKKGELPTSRVKVQATDIYFSNLRADTRIVINRGGSGSSKSFSICQLLTQKFLTEKDKNFLILRKTLPSARLSVLKLFKNMFTRFNVTYGKGRVDVKEDKTSLTFSFRSNTMVFASVEDVQRYKSTDWNYIWLEEATEFTLEEFRILYMYLRAQSTDGIANQIFLSFNPVDEFHWIREKLLSDALYNAQLTELHSTYLDNPFLPEESRKVLENLSEQDINFYRIYALGEWGRLENLIYSNWDIVDTLPDTKNCEAVICGLDFGYGVGHPTALVRIYISGRDVTIEELLYETGLTNQDLITEMPNLVDTEIEIYADSEDPQRIEEIRRANFSVRPALKGKRSVINGIDLVKRFRLHFWKGSPNGIKEMRGYSWKTDKSGRPLPEPVKFADDMLDAIRMALFSHFQGKHPDIAILERSKAENVEGRPLEELEQIGHDIDNLEDIELDDSDGW